jgi:hypothetical protein
VGNQIKTEKKYSSGHFEEMTICDMCLEERRVKSQRLWIAVLVVSVPLAVFLIGVFGAILAIGMLANLRRAKKESVGDMIVARVKQHPGKKILGIENDYKTREEYAKLGPM